ncbi:hypothetical protein [Falsarthrobacter nasiphocae]|uniref:G:T-mismatch repair DNA endonuclease (Very short patch repair protein) n=1 Tax=Falsarthrobacter nasiphocae TaxID=189863 RepID=A0AAE3YHI0_9MICC|nr:hypothetical protein [Falsarthrobacter nasiphocae]MDR6891871.1 G:T-mismatch repair DNA endonuclease (very short patch repair protein) [Falsarthrobacter nasiphocae]
MVILIDWLVRVPREEFEGRIEPHETLTSLREWIAAQRRIRGRPAFQSALERASVGSDSPMETKLRLALEDAGITGAVCNAVITDGGHVLGQPDLAFLEAKVAVDYHGAHHWTADGIARDLRKRDRFERAGWKYIELCADHAVHDWAPATRLIRDAVSSPSLPVTGRV